jgi:hypothetical protein
MTMCSLFLLILLIPRRLLKLIPLYPPQTHLLSPAFIYPHVTFQIPSRRLSPTQFIPTPTHQLLPQIDSRPTPTSSYPSKRNTSPLPRRFAQLLENYLRSSTLSAKSLATHSTTYQHSTPALRHLSPPTTTPLSDETNSTRIILATSCG